jgi:ankyrin repeat protein
LVAGIIRVFGEDIQKSKSWCSVGHEAVVRLLLDKGADVNAQGGVYHNALQAASERGHEAVVRLLLNKGADVNAQGGSLGNALQAASDGGHEAVVKMLVERGAKLS